MARLIAVDVGSWAVKVAVYGGAGRVHELEGVHRQRIPQDGTVLPSVYDRLAALDMLVKAVPGLHEAHLTDAVWSSQRTSVRRLVLPFDDADQIEQTLPFAVEAEVPFDLDEMVMAWRRGAAGGEVQVAIAEEVGVAALIGGLAQRGFDPRRLLVDGDVLGKRATSDTAYAAVIDIGHVHTVVSVGIDGKARFMRSLDVAGRVFTKVIQDALGCTWFEAERLKHGGEEDADADSEPTGPGLVLEDERTDPAFGASLPQKAREALHGAIGLLLAEIRSTLIQAEDELGVSIEEVVLCGGGSKIAELRTWLEQDLGLRVHDAEQTDGGDARRDEALVRSLGSLAIAEPDARLDMRVGDLAWRSGMDATNVVFRYGGAFVGSFLVAVIAMFALQFRTLHSEQAMVDARIREIVAMAVPDLPEDTTPGDASATLGELVAEMSDEAKFLGEEGAVPPMVHELGILSKLMPPHDSVAVNVDELEITAGAIRMNGVTEGFAQVDQIGQSLMESGHYGEVVATPGNRDNKGKLQFTVNIDRGTSDGDDTDTPEEGADGEGE
jgi:Tfp pilus assembly PilM family ATPase